MSDCANTTPSGFKMERVTTKHGFKARLVTLPQEAALDVIGADPFEQPIVRVDVLNESFGLAIAVFTTDGNRERIVYVIAADGEQARVASWDGS